MNRDFGENRDGVHLMIIEHSLCGDAFDIGSEGEDDILPTKKKTVTCPRCIDTIEICRGVKTKRKKTDGRT